MVLPIKDIISTIGKNIEEYGNALPIPPKRFIGWAEELDLEKGGETILFTGLLYQLVPFIDTSVKWLERLEKRPYVKWMLKLDRAFGKLVFRVSEERIRPQYEILKNIVTILRKAGVQFGYLYEDELYSGVLAYDFGMNDIFLNHARKLFNVFKQHGVKKIITIDPHTNYVLKFIYPKYVKEFNFNVENYLEILARSNIEPSAKIDETAVIHDSCYYARYENIIQQPRVLLSKSGMKLLEPPRSKNMTFCCGGPIESLFPTLSRCIADARIKELESISKNIVVCCPLCYANLTRVKSEDSEIRDISHYLYRAFSQ